MKAVKRPKNSYTIDKFLRAEEEIRLLEKRSYVGLEGLIPQLTALGLKPDMNVLEVGSGTGTRALKLAQFLTKGHVVGIDVSDALLTHALDRQKAAHVSNLEFKKMNIYDLDLPKKSFDLIYLRLVIQHLSEPVKALSNLRKLLKKGGTLFIEDTDRDWLSIYPSTAAWDALYEKVKRAQASKGGDPRSGRKLASHLLAAGFQDVETKLLPVFGAGRVFDDWVENFAPSFFNYLSKSDQKRGLAILEELKKRNRKTPIFMHQIWFQAWGKSPAYAT